MEAVVLDFENLAIFATECVLILGFGSVLISGLSLAERRLGLERNK